MASDAQRLAAAEFRRHTGGVYRRPDSVVSLIRRGGWWEVHNGGELSALTRRVSMAIALAMQLVDLEAQADG